MDDVVIFISHIRARRGVAGFRGMAPTVLDGPPSHSKWKSVT
jgi:hypothetical protein